MHRDVRRHLPVRLTYHIVPIAEAHIAGFRDAVDVVARESKYLAFLEAPPLEDVTVPTEQTVSEAARQMCNKG